MHTVGPDNGSALGRVSRRIFLQASAATVGTAGFSPTNLDRARAMDASPPRATSLIFLVLTGGPSHLDTGDPKPDAPSEVRGPFASIATRVPGISISEHFPRMAALAHRFTIVRSVH